MKKMQLPVERRLALESEKKRRRAFEKKQRTAIERKNRLILARQLRLCRKSRTFGQVAMKLDRVRAYSWKCERGLRKIGLLEWLEFMEVYGVKPADFLQRLEKALV